MVESEFWSLVGLLATSIAANIITWLSSRKKVVTLEDAVEKLNSNFSRFNDLIALYIKTQKKLKKDDQSLRELELWLTAANSGPRIKGQ